MSNRLCLCCNGASFGEPLQTDGGPYIRCTNCNSSFQASSFEHEDLALKKFEQEQDRFYGDDSVVLSPAFEGLQAESLKRRLSIIQRHLKSGYLFEVGPGNGTTLSLLRKHGYQVDAIEHSETLAKSIEERTGASIAHGDFAAMDSKREYDAYMSFHVIEHVPDFIGHLAKAAAITKRGGLAFIATPNVRSLEHYVARGLAPSYSTAHLQLFSASGLTHCCDKTGWKVIKVYTSDYPIAWLRVLTSFVRYFRGQANAKARGGYASAASPRLLRAVRLYALMTRPFRSVQGAIGLGDELLVVARKL
jgi:2-polyprenyl-3-methyl-5-hydroxy-6-metoxy-1,4-benzoquinol methylase